MNKKPTVIPWNHDEPPSEKVVRGLLLAEGLAPIRWSNRPKERYSTHAHEYDKVLVVVQGAITFGLPDVGEEITLKPGDRLELPAGIAHNAVAGAQGVACLEAHRRP
jgi:quercetin dioxygenase-like cupin family protein